MTPQPTPPRSPTAKGDTSLRSDLLTPSEIESLRQDKMESAKRIRELLRQMPSGKRPKN